MLRCTFCALWQMIAFVLRWITPPDDIVAICGDGVAEELCCVRITADEARRWRKGEGRVEAKGKVTGRSYVASESAREIEVDARDARNFLEGGRFAVVRDGES